ncbi:MAG: hypothetical protein E7248_20615 [Paenibacillaceae bacterium]|nr:hypothetical protein [Paenibacillaceae bacterium]
MSDKKYCIQLAECDCNSKEVYSYDEIEIGTWVDGKPIYRKVITGKLAEQNGIGLVFAKVPELNIDRVINLYGNMTDNHNEAQITLQTSYNRPEGLFAAVNMAYDIQNSTIKYHFLNNEGYYSGCTANVVIEYTKK